MTAFRLDVLSAIAPGTATPVTANFTGPSLSLPINGGASLYVVGGLGGGTLTLQVSPDGTNFYATTMTITGTTGFVTTPAGGLWAPYWRVVLTGATSATITAITMVFTENNI